MAIYPGAIACRACGADYDIVWGVPFLGCYGEEDVPGLVEIAANANNYRRHAGAPSGDGGIDHWIDLLEAFHHDPDKSEDFFRRHDMPDEARGWFPNRYAEHLLFRVMTGDLALGGIEVLDVGAGTGFDSQRFVRAGSRVTAFDYSPVLAHEGSYSVPEARWFCGTMPVLPFADRSFDLVVANAALHHMKDVSGSIEEMLRVVRPGGHILTLCDSFRADDSPPDALIEIFKDDPAVLSGVNEGVPRLGEFLDPLERHGGALHVRILTSHVQAPGLARELRLSAAGPREWTLADARRFLAQASGTIAMRAQVRAPLRATAPVPPREVVRPAALGAALDEEAAAVAMLARHVPKHLTNLALMGDEHAWFRLLNGWKPARVGDTHRVCHGRARLFLSDVPAGAELAVELLVPHDPDAATAEMEIAIDGRAELLKTLCRGVWTHFHLDWPAAASGRTVAVEIRLVRGKASGRPPLFLVRGLEVGPAGNRGRPAQLAMARLQEFGLSALREIGLLNRDRVFALFSTDHALGIEILNRIRQMGLACDAVVAATQEALYRTEQAVRIVGTYADQRQPARVDGALRPESILIVAGDVRHAFRLLRMLPVAASVPRFAVSTGGFAVDLAAAPARSGASAVAGLPGKAELRAAARHVLATMPFGNTLLSWRRAIRPRGRRH